jgi:MFS family permease
MNATAHSVERARSLPAIRTGWLAWGLAASCYVLAMFHRMSLGVASFDAGHRFGAGAGMVTTISIIGLVAYLVGQVPAGLLADRIGPRRALVVGLSLMTAGETLFAISTSPAPALAGRALIGLGDACIFLNVLRVAAQWFPREQFAPLASATAALGAVGQLATTVPLNHALHTAGWSATFLAGSAVTGALAILVAALLRERPIANTPTPTTPTPTTPIATTPIATTPTATTPIATAVGMRGGIIRAWRRPGTRTGFWLHFTTMAPFVVLTGLWGAPTLVDAQHLTRAHASALLLAAVASTAASAPLIGAYARRRPERRLAVGKAIGVAVIVALAVLTITPAAHIPLAVTLACLVTLGIGCATAMLSFDIARRPDDHHDGASTSALVNLGGFGAAITGDITVAAARSTLGVHTGTVLLPVLLIALLGFANLARRKSADLGVTMARSSCGSHSWPHSVAPESHSLPMS